MLRWVLVVLATTIAVLNVYNAMTRPTVGVEYSRRDGIVESVLADGPAGREGIRVGDRIRKINGHVIGAGVVPLYFVRAGEDVPIRFERAGAEEMVIVKASRGRSVRVALHLLMLAAGIVLLVKRAAPLLAMALVAGGGSMFMYRAEGFGMVLSKMPMVLSVPLVILDAMFAALFVGALIHFALTFRRTETPRWRLVVPYVVALPIFAHVLLHNLVRLDGSVRPVAYVEALRERS